MIVRWQTDQKKKERWELEVQSVPPPTSLLIDWGVKLIKILQKCNTVLTFPSSSSLSLTLPSLFIPLPPLRHFFFHSPMSLSVQWIICLLLANVMPLLTGLTGSQSHTMQHRLWTLLLKVLLKFLSYFLYRGRCDYRNWLDVSFFFPWSCGSRSRTSTMSSLSVHSQLSGRCLYSHPTDSAGCPVGFSACCLVACCV